jgi:hypothetical protein
MPDVQYLETRDSFGADLKELCPRCRFVEEVCALSQGRYQGQHFYPVTLLFSLLILTQFLPARNDRGNKSLQVVHGLWQAFVRSDSCKYE